MIVVVVIGYGILSASFVRVPQNYQWILAIISPFVREVVGMIMVKFAYKSAGVGPEGKQTVKFSVLDYIITKHALYLAIIVGVQCTLD